MKKLVALALVTCAVSACSTLLPGSVGSGDTAASGGLPSDVAAHPSVEEGTPTAFALSSQAAPFLEALQQKVQPMRIELAHAIEGDQTISQGLANWEATSGSAQLSILERVASLEAQVMGCQVPPLVDQPGQADVPGTMAYFDPSQGDIGQVVIYPDEIAQGGQWLALATVVHEMRHAAQYQLLNAVDGQGTGAPDTDPQDLTLANAYASAWQAMSSTGGETQLSYGDYAHLNVEYDAFQTGNEVSALVSGGQFDAMGYGFVDTHFSAVGKPDLDVTSLAFRVDGVGLITDVNEAEYQAELAETEPVQRHRLRVGYRSGRHGVPSSATGY